MRLLHLIVILFIGYANAEQITAKPSVLMKTTFGEVLIELEPQLAPVSVENFLGYVRRGDYDGTVFHRVIPGFMVQGGGHDPDMTLRPDGDTILNEADNGLANVTGTIAMARMAEIDSASRQFFINVNDNTHLDHKSTSCTREQVASVAAARQKGLYKPLACDSYGYTVFGRVVGGMGVIERIAGVETRTVGGHRDVPLEPVLIESVVLIDGS